MRTPKLVALTATVLAAGLTPLALPNPAAAAPARYADDFNGDGYRDLVTAAPGATVGGKARAGAVVVTYGSRSGIKASRRTVITQNSPAVPGTAEKDDSFGSALAFGDLDNDGYADLVVGAEKEDAEAGAVVIVWGGRNGLSGGRAVPDPAPSAHQRYGMSLAVGDFTGDHKADLAVGSTGKDVWIFKGGFTRAAGAASRSVLNADLYPGNVYGAQSLASGDVDGDGTDDLVVSGTYHPDDSTFVDGNLVYRGSRSGFTLQRVLNSGGWRTAVVGDLNRDGYDDVVTSAAPGTVSANDGGSVRAYLGGASGVRATPQATINQNSPGVPDTAESSDWFGDSLSVGDVNGDGYADVAVGAPFEALGSAGQTGAVTLLRGSAAGLTGTGAKTYSQNTPGVPGGNEANDFFGNAVHLADLNGDRKADLTVGVRNENNGDGAVTSLRGSASGLTTTGAVSFGPAAAGVSASGYPQLGFAFGQ
ncbi:FG-GAP and VCBS repeat-containing protein [Streptomyces sp. NPDC049687]|uniref:FG-GAP and VCBS repeat-containing protein n=1 Tax=Streptomyces sp. NPDC049687 TaxID=3365596 RepID=UPI0037890957